MTKEQRKALRGKIIETLNEITEDQSNKDSVVTLGAHTIVKGNL